MPARASWTSVAVFVVAFLTLLLACPEAAGYFSNRDHGLQLGLGTQILHGKVPSIDFDFFYGPAVWYVSALALGLSGGLIGETLFCAAGHACALTLVFVLVARRTSILTGLAACLSTGLLLARFYKWYIWLMPLAVLALWEHHRRRRSPGSAALLGLGLGIASLFRVDLGVTCTLAVLLLMALPVGGATRRDRPRNALLVLACTALPHLLWLVYLGLAGGASAPLDYVRMMAGGSSRLASGMGMPLPMPDWSALWSYPSRLSPGYALLPTVYVAALAWGWIRLRRARTDDSAGFLVSAALIGGATLHQTLHRSDAQHLLQVVPPAILLSAVLLAELGRARFPGRKLLLAGGAVFTLVAFLGLLPHGRVDLRSPASPGAKLAALAHPLEHDSTWTEAIRELREQVAPDESILVFPIDPQLYALADREMAGRIYGYYAGVFDHSPFQERNLEELRRNPPARVLVPARLYEPGWREDTEMQRGRRAHAPVDELIRSRYTALTYRNERYAILARPAE